MGDVRAPFPMIQDTNEVGKVLDQAVDATTAVAGLLGLIGFAFKDANGNAVLPQLDAEGKLPVTSDAAGTILRARGVNIDQDSSADDVAGASITLPVDTTFVQLGMVVSCRRAALFELVQVDDATTTILHSVLVDSGQYTVNVSLPVDQIISGSTGTQTLKVRAATFEKAANVYASLSAKQVS